VWIGVKKSGEVHGALSHGKIPRSQYLAIVVKFKFEDIIQDAFNSFQSVVHP
jgi:hypothetical protein